MRPLRLHVISAQLCLFDTFFRALLWCGSGHVTVLDVAGGVNQAQAVVQADDEGYLALQAAGFVVEELGEKYFEASPSVRK